MKIQAIAGLLALGGALAGGGLQAQELAATGPDGELRLMPTDLAVLSAEEPRNDLPCEVEHLDPQLEFDLNFQAGFNVSIPLSSLEGPGNALRILFRIQPTDAPGDPVYFRQRISVPPIDEGAEGTTTLPGRYRLGPGVYKVDWLMRDRAERVCADSWEIRAETLEGFEKLAATASAHSISPVGEDLYFEEPPIRRARGKLKHVKIIMNFTPLSPSRVNLLPYDKLNVMSMLRGIAREPTFGSFSLVVFNMHEERVIFEEVEVPRLDFPALGQAIEDIQGGAVAFEKLEDKESSKTFLRQVFEEHVRKSDDEPDVILFLGPKVVLKKEPKGPFLARSTVSTAPLFYFIYNRNPRAYPWKGGISVGLRGLGATEIQVVTPRNFGKAMKDLLEALAGAGTGTSDS